MTIDDNAIIAALQWMFRTAKSLSEPSGAISVAAALAERASGSLAPRGAAVAVISGGNVEPRAFSEYLSCDLAK